MSILSIDGFNCDRCGGLLEWERPFGGLCSKCREKDNEESVLDLSYFFIMWELMLEEEFGDEWFEWVWG